MTRTGSATPSTSCATPDYPAAAGRSAPELQAKSRHRHLGTLGVYVTLGKETAARITAEADPHRRRRR
jgi:hypothetical protein